LDCLFNFAKLAKNYHYVKPTINIGGNSRITNSRHPVVEQIIGNDFVPNDIEFDVQNQQIIILTGPNMSGKSTYIRQVALVFLMAQIGSFVPASFAEVAIIDRIFTRVGASDNLASGESTFMVEMLETANILNNATENSLIILDEVGRGTSTFDGVAIAWAIVDYIVKNIKAKTLFATHYHELLFLEQIHEEVKNFKVEVLEENDQVSFMHKIAKGGIDKSYGIHVAKLAGVPSKVITRSKEILLDLQKRSINKLIKDHVFIDTKQMGLGETIANPKQGGDDRKYSDLKQKISEIDLNNLSPLDVLNKLNAIQKGLKDD
jgi:DNA mismatch repair protein MutS